MLRLSGRKGPVRGKLIDERKFVTKDSIPYSGTGWKNRGVEGEAQFIVTGHHDQDRQAVAPVHLDGKNLHCYCPTQPNSHSDKVFGGINHNHRHQPTQPPAISL